MENFSKHKFKYLSWILPALIFSLICSFGVLPLTTRTLALKKDLIQKEKLNYSKPWLDSVNTEQSKMLVQSEGFLAIFKNKISQEKSADALAKIIRKLFTSNKLEVSKVMTEERSLRGINRVSVRVSGTCGFSELNNLFKTLYSSATHYEIAQMIIRKKKTNLSYALTIHAYIKDTAKLVKIKIIK